MSEITRPDRVPPLIDALSAPLLRVRSIAVEGLARQRDARALRPIIESINDLGDADEEDVCQYVGDVMEAIASFDDRTALQTFVSHLDTVFSDLHQIAWHLSERDRSAIEALAMLYEDDVGPLEEILSGSSSIDVKMMIITLLMEVDLPKADKVLLDLVRDQGADESLIAEASYVLGIHGCEEAFKPLCRVMADKERYTDDTRSYAAIALGRIGDPRALAPLVTVLTDPDEEPTSMTTAFAVDALEMLVLDEDEEEWEEMREEEPVEDDEELLCVLIEALAFPDPDVQMLAVRGLGALRDHRTVPPILEALRDWEASEDYLAFCRQAIVAIGEIGDVSTVSSLFQTLDEIEHDSELFRDHYLYSQELYDEAFQAVAGMGEEIVGPLCEVVDGEYEPAVRAMAIQTLGFLPGLYPEVVLIEALKDTDEQEMVAWAADALGRQGATGAVGPLCRIACDSEQYEEVCRLSAIGALGEIGDPRALSTLLKMISEGERYGERSVDAYEAFESIIEMMEDQAE